ncbi:hypothetical protein CG736_02205 [Kitasatospora sp. CB02891]|nr:hypothetical protein CG736_02205 [Kitasatospora sp. CB02891]
MAWLRSLPPQAVWHDTGTRVFPCAARLDGHWWVLRLNDFPEHPLLTLFVDAEVVGDLEDSQAVWRSAPRARATGAPAASSPTSTWPGTAPPRERPRPGPPRSAGLPVPRLVRGGIAAIGEVGGHPTGAQLPLELLLGGDQALATPGC